jgi:DNA modification methylase
MTKTISFLNNAISDTAGGNDHRLSPLGFSPELDPPGREPIPLDQDLARPLRQPDDVRHAIENLSRVCSYEQVPLGDIRPNPKNARKHSDHQIKLLMGSINAFGFVGVLVIGEDNVIVSGHGRFEAARRLQLASLPCVRVEHLTPEAKAALALADNKLAEHSSWDEAALAETLSELSTADLDFDIGATGFDSVDLDRLLGNEVQERHRANGATDVSEDPADEIPEIRNDFPSVSQLGMAWRLGKHCVVHGDALDPSTYSRLLGDQMATQVVTDPPYNVPNAGHVSSKNFREFPMAHGELSAPQFTGFLAQSLKNSAAHLRDGAILHVFMDWRHMNEMQAAAAAAKLLVKNLCVWAKPSPGQGSFYRSQHELVFVLKYGASPHINNFGLGGRGRTRSNVWKYPAVRGVRMGVNDPDEGHPTVKPVALIMDAIRDCSKRGDIILDPFGGSGTTLIAAERVGRLARLIELDGNYVDLIIRRWQAATGGNAIEMDSGLTFNELEHRLSERPGEGR